MASSYFCNLVKIYLFWAWIFMYIIVDEPEH